MRFHALRAGFGPAVGHLLRFTARLRHLAAAARGGTGERSASLLRSVHPAGRGLRPGPSAHSYGATARSRRTTLLPTRRYPIERPVAARGRRSASGQKVSCTIA
jgi:hypothetical protein